MFSTNSSEFVQQHLYTVEVQGEIDVVGISLAGPKLYVCEVAIHLSTGLQYTKEKRPNNIQKLTEKFSKDIEYARARFKDYEHHFMLWSPIVKRRSNPVYDQMGHLEQVSKVIEGKYGVKLDLVVNKRFQDCLEELRDLAAVAGAELKSPVMRLLQIEEQLERHLAKQV
ncbi:MAG: hypothetical protein IPP88_04890 [Betaproteobacteria bacterium]|nr:hypothetical protein [Betaproteobacteria bacterium]